MKNRQKILILLVLFSFGIAQGQFRKVLKGQVLNDSIPVENGYVFNLNSKTRTLIQSDGSFDIPAKSKDTLLISSMAFRSQKIILTTKNIELPLLIIKLDFFENELKEVLVSKKTALKPISSNSQKYVDMPFFDDEKSSPKNTTMPSFAVENSMDLWRIGTKVIPRLFKKKAVEKTPELPEKDFTKEVFTTINRDFFTQTLALKLDEINLFLMYCETDSRAKELLKLENKFQLIDFLITKNKAFKRISTFEK